MRLRALHLADLNDPDLLRELVEAPESEALERKRTAEPLTLAKVVSGFANAHGGWLLLGVDDDGAIVGWEAPGRSHVRDWLRDLLDNHLDPLPHFDAQVFVHEGTPIAAVWIPRSSAAPHFMDATGEVFERRNGQTRRALAHRVRELMTRGQDLQVEVAGARLDDRNKAFDLAVALNAPRVGSAMPARTLESIVRVSLLEPIEQFEEWVHTSEALARSEGFAREAASALNDRGGWFDSRVSAQARTTVGGHVASASWDGHILKELTVAWDRTGLGGVRYAESRPDDSGVFYLLSDHVRDRWLVTALGYLFGSLEQAGVVGPALLRWDLYGIRGADVTTVRDGNIVAAQGVIPPHYQNAVLLDLDVEIGAATAEHVARRLWSELERLAGCQRF